jgi:hypothetical protein
MFSLPIHQLADIWLVSPFGHYLYQSGLFRETEPIGDFLFLSLSLSLSLLSSLELHYEELAVIMEAVKPHYLLSASLGPQRFRKVGSVIQSQFESPRTRETSVANPNPRTGDQIRCSSSSSQAGKKKGNKFLFPPPFVPFRPSTNWMMLNQPYRGG